MQHTAPVPPRGAGGSGRGGAARSADNGAHGTLEGAAGGQQLTGLASPGGGPAHSRQANSGSERGGGSELLMSALLHVAGVLCLTPSQWFQLIFVLKDSALVSSVNCPAERRQSRHHLALAVMNDSLLCGGLI